MSMPAKLQDGANELITPCYSCNRKQTHIYYKYSKKFKNLPTTFGRRRTEIHKFRVLHFKAKPSIISVTKQNLNL